MVRGGLGGLMQATLNVRDALSYLDQVKVQFTDHPDVYNRFLDIMKDFKSQAIDTPGVIERVSTLFRGQPSLIQGFNTFLPPGYRIECSVDQNDANMITVTTPSGTTTQSLGGHGIAGAISRMSKGGGADVGAPGGSGGPGAPPGAPGVPHAHAGPEVSKPPRHPGAPGAVHGEPYAPGLGHEYDAPLPPPGLGRGGAERPGSVLPPPRGAPTPPPGGGGAAPGMGMYGGAPPSGAPLYEGGARSAPGAPGAHHHGAPLSGGAPGGTEGVRPPVEFNHAINYVNKIKQRFSGEPDTYKQFLEILQTYQKEQRPIHEVYAQVTVLFDHAQDLLEEFKQFLPDTGAHGGGAPGGLFGMLGHVTNGMAAPGGEAGAPGGVGGGYEPLPGRHGASAHGARKKRSMSGVDDAPLPPDGAPGLGKSVARPKRSKHAKGDSVPRAAHGAAYALPPGAEMHEMYGAPVPHGVPHGYELPPEAPAPGFVPGGVYDVPPYAPPPVLAAPGAAAPAPGGAMQLPHMATVDEVAFFERVKKHIDDRAAYVDFLKLLNLYTQDVIDIGTLVDRVSLFLGGQPELLAAFKTLIGYDMGKHGWLEHEEPVLENVPVLERERFDLSTQRSYGPSYRKLPDSEINLSCSGRDPLCWEVLNDAWVSHPTWASEGESFNPHKKNVYEDALYRSEEERHEYDYHIEANLRTIALLEPIAARIAIMDADERASFRLKPGLGGQSKSIYQRIIKKVYGRNHGLEVIAALHDNPSVAVPVVLARLKQKDEEWKRAQREWNKVWREVDARNFYKALDHQGINFKSTDKKTITTKAFVHEIETLRTEQQQRRLALDPSLPALAPRFQLAYALDDGQVVLDVLRLALHFVDRASSGFSASEKERVVSTLRQLLPRLFHMDAAVLDALATRRTAPDDDEARDETPDDAEAPRARARSTGSAAQRHAETRPTSPPAAASTWHVNTSADAVRAAPADAPADAPVELFANTTLYVFVRLVQLLYARLHQLKTTAADLARDTPAGWTKVNPLAAELGLADTAHGPAGVVGQIAAAVAARTSSDGARAPPATSEAAAMQLHPTQYYDVLLELVARLFDHEIDQATYEESVRFVYGIHGYRAMTLDKVIHALVKTALTISADTKCQELLNVFDTTHAALEEIARGPRGEDAPPRDVQVYKRRIAARMDAEHVLGRDEHLFRIEMACAPAPRDAAVPPQTMRIQLLSHDDLTLEDPRDEEQRWLQYIASYCLYAPTEGLPGETRAPLLQRTLPASPDYAADAPGTHYVVRNGLDIRVCMRTYRLFFVHGTEDVFARVRSTPRDEAAAQRTETERKQRWHAWLDARHAAMAACAAPDKDGDAPAEEAPAERAPSAERAPDVPAEKPAAAPADEPMPAADADARAPPAPTEAPADGAADRPAPPRAP
ncbi:hypothetical protein MBRA1_003570 [Malassezia brasiliensis]|uniref:Histone deacetylase interacting domain-containing protein n=1 Tax=Malassezia brasiliensis TaxID=1821822 RepID=A0AAF0DV40_9BASI|nr:hypothetical protein MBRA1_003570 [Malassezia brasiliensis]